MNKQNESQTDKVQIDGCGGREGGGRLSGKGEGD